MVAVGLEPVEGLGAVVLGVHGLAEQAVPVGVGLLLGVEGPLVDQALLLLGAGREVGELVDGHGVRAIGGEHVGGRRDQPLLRVVGVDTVGDLTAAVVDDQARGVHEDHDVVVGELGVRLGDAGGLHVDVLDLAGRRG